MSYNLGYMTYHEKNAMLRENKGVMSFPKIKDRGLYRLLMPQLCN